MSALIAINIFLLVVSVVAISASIVFIEDIPELLSQIKELKKSNRYLIDELEEVKTNLFNLYKDHDSLERKFFYESKDVELLQDYVETVWKNLKSLKESQDSEDVPEQLEELPVISVEEESLEVIDDE